jgi:hypothetical protein
MSLAYIILAHKNPLQLKKLVNALHDDNDYFIIHIDKRVEILPFKERLIDYKNVFFIEERENARWGDIGIVKATVKGLNLLYKNKFNYSHVSLLSGQDYPIKSLSYIHNFFKNNINKSFIEFIPFPVDSLRFGGVHRIKSYSFNLFGRRETFIPFKYKPKFNIKGTILNLGLGIVTFFLPQRHFPCNWKPYYGSQWWTITQDAVNVIINVLRKCPEYFDYHKYSLLPDEMFFQSLLLNNYNKHLLVNNNLRYIQWDKTGTHPKVYSYAEVENLTKEDALFARKFEL